MSGRKSESASQWARAIIGNDGAEAQLTIICSTVPRPRQAIRASRSRDPAARKQSSLQQPPSMDWSHAARLPGDESDAAVRNCVV